MLNAGGPAHIAKIVRILDGKSRLEGGDASSDDDTAAVTVSESLPLTKACARVRFATEADCVAAFNALTGAFRKPGIPEVCPLPFCYQLASLSSSFSSTTGRGFVGAG